MKRALTVTIGAAAAGVLLWAGFGILTRGERIHLSSDYFGVPLPLPDEGERSFTRVEIQAELFEHREGNGTLTFYGEKLKLDAFGDPTEEESPRGTSLAVTFQPLERVDPWEKGRRIHEVVFRDGRLQHRLYLVVATESDSDHRLVVRMEDEPTPLLENSADSGFGEIHGQVLELHEPRPRTESSAAEPLRLPLTLIMGQTFWMTRQTDNPRQFGVIRAELKLEGPAALTHDRNSRTLTAFGDPAGTTLVLYSPTPGTWKELEQRDASGRGRKLMEFLPENAQPRSPRRYQVVLARRAAGPHRLLVREGEELRYVLSLRQPRKGPLPFFDY